MFDNETPDFDEEPEPEAPLTTAPSSEADEAEYHAPANRPARNARQATSMEDVSTAWLHEGATDFLGLEQDLSSPPIAEETQNVFQIPADEPPPPRTDLGGAAEQSWLLAQDQQTADPPSPEARDETRYNQFTAVTEYGEEEGYAATETYADEWDEEGVEEVAASAGRRRSPFKLVALTLVGLILGAGAIGGFELAKRRGLLDRFLSEPTEPVVQVPPTPTHTPTVDTGTPGATGPTGATTTEPGPVAVVETPTPAPPTVEPTGPEATTGDDTNPEIATTDPVVETGPEPTAGGPVVEAVPDEGVVEAQPVPMGMPGPRSPADLLRATPSEPLGTTLVMPYDAPFGQFLRRLGTTAPLPFSTSEPYSFYDEPLAVEPIGPDGTRPVRPKGSGPLLWDPGDSTAMPVEGPIRFATAADVAGIWQEQTIPLDAIAGTDRILTPFVGPVRAVLKSNEVFEGRLFAVGQGHVWLESDLGRLALEARLVDSIHQLVELSGSGEEALVGLPRIRVHTPGGVFFGREIARDDDRITLITDDGSRVTLANRSVEVDNDTHTVVVKALEGESLELEAQEDQE